VPGKGRGGSFEIGGDYKKSMAYRSVFEMQKSWAVEVVRCINEWATGGWDANELTWKNLRRTEWMNQWANESMNQWINESVNQCSNEAMTQWINQAGNQWIDESMNQWNSEWMNQWFNKSVTQWINEAMDWLINERMIQWINDSVNRWFSNRMSMGSWWLHAFVQSSDVIASSAFFPPHPILPPLTEVTRRVSPATWSITYRSVGYSNNNRLEP